MAIFIEYPWLAAAVGALLIALGRWVRRGTPAVVVVIWLLYALYETGMKQRWLCTGECNIRLDLFLIYPLLLLGSAAALFSGVRAHWAPPRP
jgi:hypothetical protein